MQATGDNAAADGHVERTNISVKPRVFARHIHEVLKVLIFKWRALGPAMRGDHRHPTLERPFQDARIREVRANHPKGMFPASVGEEGQSGLGHAFPKASVAAVARVDVL